jgi:V/A-type H+-transporting ATPase subunit E
MDKLQQLTDKLFNEGLSKGRQEGEALLEKARAEAEVIIENARAEAAKIIASANKDAEDLKTNVSGDVRMAAVESIQATKQDIENLIITKMSSEAVSKALSEEEFVKGIIKAVAEKFSAEESSDVALVLPESLKASLEPFVKNELSSLLGKGLEATFSKKIAGGFRIGPKDGGYFISLTEDTFKNLIGEYLRPTTKKLLFGE